jgi:hypothetical protein
MSTCRERKGRTPTARFRKVGNEAGAIVEMATMEGEGGGGKGGGGGGGWVEGGEEG